MVGQGMGYTMADAALLAGILCEAGSPDELARMVDERYESRRTAHTELVEYGNDLARSFPERAAYLRAFRPDRHGRDE